VKPVAIVVPWWGKELKGGAEQQAWQVATQLAQKGHAVEVLTTCCRSFQDDWSVNHCRAGKRKEQGLIVRRFRVDKRDRATFDRVNLELLGLSSSQFKVGVSPVNLNDANIFTTANINSEQLLKYLKKHSNSYQAFLFLPYLYGIIINGLPIVSERAFLQPCLHNEVYAYLPQIETIFHAAKAILFISEGEAKLAQNLYGPGIINKSIVAGAGVENNSTISHHKSITTIQNFSVQKERYILCLGRRDSTKNTDLLIRAFAAFRQEYPSSNLKLVLAGLGSIEVSDFEFELIDLGLVEEEEKASLLANCLALFQPSRNESYSRVMMEAWFNQRPVAAHQDCLATALAVQSSQGGWLAGTEQEWANLFAKVDKLDEAQLRDYGLKGYNYAKENAVWDKVIERYEVALDLTAQKSNPKISQVASVTPKLKAIHQLLPNFSYGDAISNQALAIRNYLRDLGYRSEIFTRYVDPRVIQEVKLLSESKINPDAGLLYHHSIGNPEITNCAIAHPGSKCLIYHNITPSEFFQPFDPHFANLLEQGRKDLSKLASYFPLAVGDSAYNAAELAELGFTKPTVLPIIVNPQKWDIAPDATIMDRFQDGIKNIIFVGRITPNKKQEDLLVAFSHYLTLDTNARLILVGWGSNTEPYYYHLLKAIAKLNLSDRVIVTGQVNDAQLLAYYRTAHLFWSMSEHEGFGVPLIEAMWFDIPVLAYKSSAVPETLGYGGILFKSKDDLLQVAALAKLLMNDRDLKTTILKAQQKRRKEFLLKNIQHNLNQLIEIL
jgi:glycosyltransferase involved in cell wall biosynthesis